MVMSVNGPIKGIKPRPLQINVPTELEAAVGRIIPLPRKCFEGLWQWLRHHRPPTIFNGPHELDLDTSKYLK